MLHAVYGFINFSFLVFIIAIITAFFKKETFLLKLNLKYLGIIFIALFIAAFFGESFKSDDDGAYMMVGIPFALVFGIFVNKSGFDITTFKLHFVNKAKSDGPYSLRKDYYSSIIIGFVYLFIAWLLWQFNYGPINLLAVVSLIMGGLHAFFFGKLWSHCPYCDYKVSNIHYNTSSKRCSTCRSTFIIHDNELVRPRGREH